MKLGPRANLEPSLVFVRVCYSGRLGDYCAAVPLARRARRPEGRTRELASLGSNQLPSDALWRAVPDRDW